MKTNAMQLTILVFMLSVTARAEITECDRLAANPSDPDRVVEGIPRAMVNAEDAVAACESELAADTDNPRFAYQLGRVYFKL